MEAAVPKAVNGLFNIEDIEIDKPKGCELLVEVKASPLPLRAAHGRERLQRHSLSRAVSSRPQSIGLFL
jgi:Zn-dependent alcohol dehydrogenase